MVQILAGWICVPGVSVRCQKPKEDGFVRAHSEDRQDTPTVAQSLELQFSHGFNIYGKQTTSPK